MQEFLKPPGFPVAQTLPGKEMAKHDNPGDIVNGVRIPKKGVPPRQRVEARGKRLLLCPVCRRPECPYTVEER